MTEFDAFERRLAFALTDYASVVATDPDSANLVREIEAAARPPRWGVLRGPRSTLQLAWILLLLTALVVASTVGIAYVGSKLLGWDGWLKPPVHFSNFLPGRYTDGGGEGSYVLDTTGSNLLLRSAVPQGTGSVGRPETP